MADAIGNLFISLAMQTAQFDRQLKEIDGKLNTLHTGVASSFSKLKTVLSGLGIGAAVQQVAGWVKSMADAGEQAVILSQALGIPLAKLVELQGIFELTEGSVEDASAALLKLSGVIADARGGSESAIASFAAIGISLADIKAKGDDLDGMFRLVAERLSTYRDSTTKSAVATDLFGKGWIKISSSLQGGAAAMEAAAKRAKELDPAAERAATSGNKLASEIDDMNKAAKGAANQGLLRLEEKFSAIITALTVVATKMQEFIGWLNIADARGEEFGARWAGGLLTLLSKPSNWSMWGVIRGAIGIPDEDLPLTGMAPAPARPAAPSAAPSGGAAMRPPPKGGGGGGGGAKDDVEAEEKAVADAQRKLALTRLEADQDLADERFSRNKETIQRQRDLDELTADEAITREQELTAAKWLADRDYYAKKLEAARGDSDAMIAIENAATLAHEKEITRRAELDHQKAKSAFDQLKEGVRDFGSVIESSFSNIFDSVIEGTFKLKNALSSLMRDFGKMLASRAFKMIMEGPTGGGGLGGLLTGALGGLFKIGGAGAAGGSLSGVGAGIGAANGGSWRVAGAGGIDSQMVAFRATPGEMVDVTRQNHVGRGGGEVINISLNPSEGWVAGVADQRIVTASGQIVNVAVLESQKRTARNFGSMSAQARDRQL